MHQETFELNCSRISLALDSTLIVVVEMSLSARLVYAEVPGLDRRAMKKMSVDEAELLSQLHRWRDEAEKRLDCQVSRICVAYEAGRDGFWLARRLRGRRRRSFCNFRWPSRMTDRWPPPRAITSIRREGTLPHSNPLNAQRCSMGA